MTRTTRAAVLVVVAALAAAVTGCGPTTPLQVGTQAIQLSLSLGTEAAVQRAPVGPISVPIPPALAPFLPAAPVAAVSSAPTSAAPSATPTPIVIAPTSACPNFSPISPALDDGTTLRGPPAAGSYSYRAKTTNAEGSTTQTYAGNSVWKVTTAPDTGVTGAYDVTVVVTLGTVTSTRVFRVLTQPLTSTLAEPDATDPNQVIQLYNGVAAEEGLPLISARAPNVGIYGPAGIYLLSQQTGTSTFTPSEPIPLLQTPVGNNSFTGVGSDGTTNMTFTSTVTGTKFVNACGTKVATTQVTLTDGVIASIDPGGTVSEVTFGETLDFGLRYGGLPLSDTGTVTAASLGTGSGTGTVSRSFTYTADSVPRVAR